MAGVQNLKALFEKPKDSISPDRGRSGAISATGLETPSRPLSKVRTSFVSVERTGHRSVSLEGSRNIRSSSINENQKPNGLAIHNNDKSSRVGEPTLSAAFSTGGKKTAYIMNDEERENNIKKAKEISVILTSKDSTAKIKAFQADRLTKFEASPLSITNTTSSTSKKGIQRSPATPRINDIKVIETKSSRQSTLSKADDKSVNRSQIGNFPSHGKKQSQEASKPVRVKKLTPKSPTRPVKLPASLTTHTASSSSKTSRASPSTLSHQTLRRVSSNFQQSTNSQRRMSISSNISLMPKVQIKKKPSNIHLAESSKKPPVQSTVPPDATTKLSFLARMTRPTASTSSKIIEKTTTPSKKSSYTRPTAKNAIKNISKQETKKISSNVKREKKRDIPATKNIDASISDVSKKSLTQSNSNSIKAKHDEAMDRNFSKLDEQERIECTKITSTSEETLVIENANQETEILDAQNKKIELVNTTDNDELNNSTFYPQQENSGSFESDPEIKIEQLNTEELNSADETSPNSDIKQEQSMNPQISSDVEFKEQSSFKSDTNGLSESLQKLTQNGSIDALNIIATLPLPSPSHFESYGSDAFPSPISMKCGSFEDS
ncbi:hypothetical protein OnM2_092032 [Erysiphe neolycopersici]|uniref:Uncharacterized protein n=1 Tax=Erysiphe neolycopersici TaxID=212602 RepID=A0A420HCJ1_9PEZI|nr:hypothetical protein OnM2_092032 [Erysiphe neolycopersici]